MTDYISRADAIKAVEDLPNAYNGWSDTYDKACIIGVIEELPSAEAEWIPCSERLPECGVGLHYLVTLKNGHDFMDDVYEAFFDKYGWHVGYNELADDDIIAWMPLPTPYKGGDEE